MKTFRVRAVLIVLAVATWPSQPALALIDFDPDGTGPLAPVEFGQLELLPGNMLKRDVMAAIDAFDASGGTNLVPFTTLYQGLLGGANDIDGNPLPLTDINSDFEVTTVARTQSVLNFFDEAPAFYGVGVTNAPLPGDYLEMFAHPINSLPAADELAGTGLNDGVRILAARITGGFDDFGASESPTQVFDQFSGTDDYPGLLAAANSNGFGSLLGRVTWVNPDYFPGLDPAQTPLELVHLSQSQHQFDQVNPSARFIDEPGTAEGASPALVGAGTFVDPGNAGELGPVNGSLTSGGTGMQFQYMDATIHLEKIRVIDDFTDGAAETFVQSGQPTRSREHFDVDGVRGIHRRTEITVAHNLTASASFVVDPLNSATLTVDGNPGDTVRLTLRYLLFNPDLDLTDEGTLDSLQVVLVENTATSDVSVTLMLLDRPPSTPASHSVAEVIGPSQTSVSFDFVDFSTLDLTEITELRVMFELPASSPASLVLDSIILVPAAVVGIPGDYNGDGRVDAGDYVRWRNHLGDPDETNINNNGDGGGVTLSDYTWWKDRYGDPDPGSGGFDGQVPEPSTAALLMLAIAAMIRRKSRSYAMLRRDQRDAWTLEHVDSWVARG